MAISRRSFLWTLTGSAALELSSFAKRPAGVEIAVTMDDPKPDALCGTPGPEINHRILTTLATAQVQAALFVAGKRVDNAEGKELIADWDRAAHEICSHSYSHRSYNSPEVSYEDFADDFLKNEPVIHGYRHFTRRFRFPFLKEGVTAEKRDRFRRLLHERGYRIGHVTVDASDWYIDLRMRQRLEQNAKADTAPHRDYYIEHIRDRARYYRQLARDVLGRDIRHTLLIHHNLLNALYLEEMMQALREDGWKWVDASHVYRDPIFKHEPKIVPAGESLIWAMAKESGRFENRLRYPGEDGDYEKAKMDALGL
jgi:peptidoglycan-N-acetylglucosamine deacetylase